MNLSSTFPLYSNAAFFPLDLINVKFILSPESNLPFGPVDAIKRYWRLFCNELTWQQLSLDLQGFLVNLASYAVQGACYEAVISKVRTPLIIGGAAEYPKKIEAIPDAKYLSVKLSTFVALRTIFYPVNTAVLRFLNGQVSFGGMFALFTSVAELRNLYRGFGYHAAWTFGYGTLSCLEEILNYRYLTQTESELSGKFPVYMAGYTALTAAYVAMTPLRVKALFDQVGKPFVFSWSLSIYRFLAGGMLRDSLGN